MLRKWYQSAWIVCGVVLMVFVLFQWLGDPVKMVAGQSGNKKTIENIRKELNLDQPVWKRFVIYLNDLSPLSIYNRVDYQEKEIHGISLGNDWKFVLKFPYLGRSYQTKNKVGDMLWDAFPGTLILAIAAILIALVGGISLGLLAAFKKDHWPDRLVSTMGVLGISAPSFFVAIILAWFFGVFLHSYTGLNFSGSLFEIDEDTGEKMLRLSNLILPAVTLGIRPLVVILQLTRSYMLEILSSDYIRTAKAKGLTRRRIIFFHALPNAMNPIFTALTSWFAELLAGSFFVEYIFGWKGIGKLTINALDKLDFPVVTGAVVFSAVLFILIQLLTDLLLQKLDKRIL